ncbi:MAG: hypothetical protein LC633_01190 [Desulfobulbaceae bacterium]|nr:hypothetical protein [Desulfobulbaceae bacterium]
MYKAKSRRRHERHKVTQINPIKLNGSDDDLYFVVPVDESESGLGCIYSGAKPPLVGHVYAVEREGGSRRMEVKWIAPIGTNRFRLGMMYVDVDFD